MMRHSVRGWQQRFVSINEMADIVRENTIRTIWKQGGAVINGWLGIPSSVAAENMAQAGWDGLTVDMQHGLVDYQTAVTMLQAISTTGTAPMARVAWLEPGIIMKLLDAGAWGIVCPMINTREECETFVGACRYPPRGYRSFGPVRATWYCGPDYYKNINDNVITMAMIETKQAVDNLDDILSVPGLDSIYIGPNDLAISLRLRTVRRADRQRGARCDQDHRRRHQEAQGLRGHPLRIDRDGEADDRARLPVRHLARRQRIPQSGSESMRGGNARR